LILKASKEACDWANTKMMTGENQYLLNLQRKGMQVVIPMQILLGRKQNQRWSSFLRQRGL